MTNTSATDTSTNPNTVQTVLGFDFGTTRIGVAIGQSLTGLGRPLSPLKANEGIPNWDLIAKLVEEWQPDAFVVGLPLNMDGSENEMCQRARKFAKRLHGRYNRPYHMMDERLSSYEAKGQVIAQGGNRNFKENSVDGLAAQMILESWFAQQAASSDVISEGLESHMKLDLDKALASMKQQLADYCQRKQIENPIVVGIHSGGVWVANEVLSAVPTNEELATLDITFYRDDFTRAGLHPKVGHTQLPALEDRHVILVDDVLMSGRTIRAAMNEIFDFGRPASIALAILYDLDSHELPIRADIVGEKLSLAANQRVKLSGPSPISVSVIETH